MKAVVVLQDGTFFEGQSVGASGTTFGEAVFATGMTGYQEMLTDPSFAGQLLTLTYPLVGNYGVNADDVESDRIQVEGFIIRVLAPKKSNWRATGDLGAYLKQNGIVAICGVDTRALTRHLRVHGVMMGAISTEKSMEELFADLETVQPYSEIDFVKRVSTKEPYVWQVDTCEKPICHIALIDLGVKRNIMRSLAGLGCKITIVPCDWSAEQILSLKPDGIVYSPGPGDPELLDYAVKSMSGVIGRKPVMGICLGHQLMGRAFGGRTFKLKFGHRGANHPVKDLTNGRVSITSQNHGYAIDSESLDASELEITQANINDGTVEGFKHRKMPVITSQYHPEASPGPLDTSDLFTEFLEAVTA